MKAYVVIEGYSCEGYGTPKAVFSTQVAAEAHAAEMKRECWPVDYIDVIELAVDDPAVEPRKVASL